MNELKKKQLEIAKKIVEQGNCEGVSYDGYHWENEGRGCPLLYNGCDRYSEQAVEAAKAYIKKHSKISKKDLLERIEKLEEMVDSTENACAPGDCNSSEGARNLKRQLEGDILSLVVDYEEKTGLKVSMIDLKTGPFLQIDLADKRCERNNHRVKVTINL